MSFKYFPLLFSLAVSSLAANIPRQNTPGYQTITDDYNSLSSWIASPTATPIEYTDWNAELLSVTAMETDIPSVTPLPSLSSIIPLQSMSPLPAPADRAVACGYFNAGEFMWRIDSFGYDFGSSSTSCAPDLLKALRSNINCLIILDWVCNRPAYGVIQVTFKVGAGCGTGPVEGAIYKGSNHIMNAGGQCIATNLGTLIWADKKYNTAIGWPEKILNDISTGAEDTIQDIQNFFSTLWNESKDTLDNIF
ncbi:hypothetical protein B7494_g2844 [Chlorociboria aeruginascens]|nr:hypothetical protein B7494_g2844 [Chlorociboria aeruginascens]